MHEVSSRYELDNETEGVFGNTFSGFEKHKFRVKYLCMFLSIYLPIYRGGLREHLQGL